MTERRGGTDRAGRFRGPAAAAAAGLLLAATTPLTGCRFGGDGKSFANENDELRAENLRLARAVEDFEGRARLLETELKTLREDRRGDAPLEGAVVPVLSDLKFARYTGPIDSDDDGRDDRVMLYLQPTDQLGRTRIVAARLNVQAVALQAGQAPRVIADRTYEPPEFDAAWRTGLTGDHYSVQLDLPGDLPPELETITVQLTLTEAGTGIVREAQESFVLRR